MDTLPIGVAEFINAPLRREAHFPSVTNEQSYAIEYWLAQNKDHQIEQSYYEDAVRGRVLVLKKKSGNLISIAPVAYFTDLNGGPSLRRSQPKSKSKANSNPGTGAYVSPPKRSRIDPSQSQPMDSTPSSQSDAYLHTVGRYDDKRVMFVRGLLDVTIHNWKSASGKFALFEQLKRVVTNLSLYLHPIKTIHQVKNSTDGIGPQIQTWLHEIQEGDFSNTPPPRGHFTCAAPAILVAMLQAKREHLVYMSKEHIIERADPISEESFDTIAHAGKSECIAWSRMVHLEKLNYVKSRQRKNICANGVFTLEPAGEHLARQLLGEIPADTPADADTTNTTTTTTSTNTPSSPTSNTSATASASAAANRNVTPTRRPPRPAAPILPLVDANSDAMISNGAGQDGIFVLIDFREFGGEYYSLGKFCDLLKAKGVRFMTRSMITADYMVIKRVGGKEFVLPFFVERKRIDDLAGSIMDGRYRTQKDTLLFVKQRYADEYPEDVALIYIVEGNMFTHMNDILQNNLTADDIEAAKNETAAEGFAIRSPENMEETRDIIAQLFQICTDTPDIEPLGTYEEFTQIVKDWKRTQAPALVRITSPFKKAQQPNTFVTCPLCQNILIGSDDENEIHVLTCNSKVRYVPEADVCPSCSNQIKGDRNHFSFHVQYCLA